MWIVTVEVVFLPRNKVDKGRRDMFLFMALVFMSCYFNWKKKFCTAGRAVYWPVKLHLSCENYTADEISRNHFDQSTYGETHETLKNKVTCIYKEAIEATSWENWVEWVAGWKIYFACFCRGICWDSYSHTLRFIWRNRIKKFKFSLPKLQHALTNFTTLPQVPGRQFSYDERFWWLSNNSLNGSPKNCLMWKHMTHDTRKADDKLSHVVLLRCIAYTTYSFYTRGLSLNKLPQTLQSVE